MSKLDDLCIKWLNENYNNMEPFVMEKYPDYIFHMKGGKCVLQYNKKNGYVYVSYSKIWSFFESFFGMNYQQIKDITKIWADEHYEMGATQTGPNLGVNPKRVEEHYEMGVTTTDLAPNVPHDAVEEHYEMGVTTTISASIPLSKTVEEQYKEIQTSYFDPPYNPESVMASEITNQPVTDWPYNENFVNELYEQKTNG